MSTKSGLIFDIKRYAINDGPGIRTTVFFKGCPLSCAWCHNPESMHTQKQRLYNADKCIGCKACVESCGNEALTLTSKGIVIDVSKCEVCGICADVCPTKATEMSGRLEPVANIVKEIEKETIFHDSSEGGVTISGGEPLLQSGYLLELLTELGQRDIHRCIDTTGLAQSETLLKIASEAELFLFDLKHMDPTEHKKWTGVDNKLIHKNLKLLAESGKEIIIRIPFIKGVNADEENVRSSAQFIASLAGEPKIVNLLAYHNIMGKKYEKLGKSYDLNELKEPSQEDMEKAVGIFADYGVTAKIGG